MKFNFFSSAPPPYEAAKDEKILFPQTKALQWKEQLLKHEYPDIEKLVDKVIEIIDIQVEFGTFPAGFSILDATSEQILNSTWKSNHKILSEGGALNTKHNKIICLKDEKNKDFKHYIDNFKVGDRYEKRTIERLVDRTGLRIEKFMFKDETRVLLADPTNEFNVSHIKFEIELP